LRTLGEKRNGTSKEIGEEKKSGREEAE